MINQERVKELFDYNEETGVITRKVNIANNKVKTGDNVGSSSSSHGYLECSIDKKSYLVHRIIWLWYYGYLPESLIDHVDEDKLNNRINNLREASKTCNAQNCGNPKNNKSGVKGVYWCNNSGYWKAQIGVNNRVKHIITTDDFEEAVCARLAAEQCINWNECCSSSPVFNYINNMRK